ncbi:MAG: hypothetical protein RL362_1530 [Bacteroidota bacterium]
MSDLSDRSKPLLAVFMVTYNHENYVEQAILSVVQQKVNFKIQLFIGEDKSTDGTLEICKRLQSEYPNIIQVLTAPSNIGVYANASNVFEACINSGAKYIALLEGDDYWSNPNKLQSQVDILESDDNIAGSYHNTEFLYKDGERKPMKKSLPLVLELKDVISKYAPFHTSSFVFRAKDFCRPSWFQKIDSVDLAMYVWHAQFGRFEGINEVMSTYRIHSSSLTASESHKNYFHDKRVILHRMMQGKISHQYFEKYRDLIRFHEAQAYGHWKKELKYSIALFSSNANKVSDDIKMLRMKLDAEIVNCEISNSGELQFLDSRIKLFKHLGIWNKFRWKMELKGKVSTVPKTLIFIEESDFLKFLNSIQSFAAKVILLFPIDQELLVRVKNKFADINTLDWASMDLLAREKFVQNWNMTYSIK